MDVRLKNGEPIWVIPKFSGRSDEFDHWFEVMKSGITFGYRSWLVESPPDYDPENPILAGVSQDEWTSAQKAGYHAVHRTLHCKNKQCAVAIAMVDSENFTKLLASLVNVYRGNMSDDPDDAFVRLSSLRLTHVSEIPDFVCTFKKGIRILNSGGYSSDRQSVLLEIAITDGFIEQYSLRLIELCNTQSVGSLTIPATLDFLIALYRIEVAQGASKNPLNTRGAKRPFVE